MNTKSLLVAGVFGLGSIGLATAADQYVYMSGSTAARAVVYTALTTVGEVFSAAPVVVTQNGSSASGSTSMNFTGHLQGEAGAKVTTIKCYWSGSEAGIKDVAKGVTEQFLDDTAASSTSNPGPFVGHTVDLAMGDNAQNYSQTPSPTLASTRLAVLPFQWVAEKGSSTNLTGVNEIALRNALNGGCQVIQFAGCPNDLSFVYVSGRDVNSGTRANTLGISGFGINSSPSQLQIDSTGNMITQADGNILEDVGYSGGGSLATQMGYSLAGHTDQVNGGNAFSVIGYLGVSDAATAIFNGGALLTYDGVAYSIQNIINCCYPFWGYEYIYEAANESAYATEVYNLLAAGVQKHADDLISTKTGNQQILIKLTDMKCTRTGPTTDPVY